MLIFIYKVGNSMKRILKVFSLFLLIVLLSGCKSSYKSITYTKFNEYFLDKPEYLVVNQTLNYQDKFERCLEANGKNIVYVFYEFKTEDEARKYMEDNYKSRKGYSFKSRKNYIRVKSTKKMYFYGVQTDKMVIVGQSPIKKNRKEIRKVLKDLGF